MINYKWGKKRRRKRKKTTFRNEHCVLQGKRLIKIVYSKFSAKSVLNDFSFVYRDKKRNIQNVERKKEVLNLIVGKGKILLIQREKKGRRNDEWVHVPGFMYIMCPPSPVCNVLIRSLSLSR